MKTKPLVTVIIATHNRAHCLPRALDSIYAQEGLGSLYELEVIIVDDGSTDSTPEIIHRYQNLTCIRLLEKRGISAAMNEGLRASRGSYITFLDDDDEWLPHKLRVQVPLIEAHPEVGVVYGQSLKRSGEKEWLIPDLTRAPSGQIFSAMLMDNFCGHHASILVCRSAFDSAGGFDESLLSYEDWDVSLRLAFHVKFLFNPGAVDVYNLSPNGLWLSRAASGTGADDARRVLEKNLQLLPDSAEHQEFKWRARLRLELDTSIRIADPIQAWARVTAALREFPGVLGDDWPKTVMGDVLTQLILQPKLDIWKFSSQLREATPNNDASRRKSFQSTIVRIMAGIAGGPATSNRTARRVTVCAFAYAPFCLTGYKLILRIAVRTLLGRRAESVCCGAYKKVKRIRPSAAEASAVTWLVFHNPKMHIRSNVSLNSQENRDVGQPVSRLRTREITRELSAPEAKRHTANQCNALVTVVVPSFNRASTIEAALGSIQRQTCALWEAVVVDDGSVDDSADRVAQLARDDSRIRLIRHPHNRGAQAARNTGIDAARTKWIAFLDSDDEWMPESLELRLDAAQRNRLQVIHTGAYVIRENGDRSLYKVPAVQGWIYTQLLKRPGPMFQGLLVAKEALTKIGGLDERIVALQEWETTIRLAKQYRFGFIAEPTFVWNCRGGHTITKDKRRDAMGYEQVVRKHFFSMLRTGPETLSTHYRKLAERYSEASAKPDALRSRLYAEFWQFVEATPRALRNARNWVRE